MKMKKRRKESNASQSIKMKKFTNRNRMSHEYCESEEERKSFERTETEQDEEEISKCLQQL